MKLFCDKCNNLLTEITTINDYFLKCNKCQINYNITPDDTLKFESDNSNNDFSMYKNILSKAVDDETNPIVYNNCKKCNNNLIKQIRLGLNMTIVNTCMKCNEQWIENN